MENTYPTPMNTTENSNGSNRKLLYILFGTLVVALVLVSFYLFTQIKGVGTGKPSINQGTTSQNIQTPVATPQGNTNFSSGNGPFVYTVQLQPATLNQQYESTISGGIYNLNSQLTGDLVSGYPQGLKVTSCQTEYNSPEISQIATKNSFVTCIIGGTPTEAGDFNITFGLTVQGDNGVSEKVIPLTVNP